MRQVRVGIDQPWRYRITTQIHDTRAVRDCNTGPNIGDDPVLDN